MYVCFPASLPCLPQRNLKTSKGQDAKGKLTRLALILAVNQCPVSVAKVTGASSGYEAEHHRRRKVCPLA